MKGGTGSDITPGDGGASKLYLRLAGTSVGLRMPPTGPLEQAQITNIKNWIEQGADWPDDLSGDPVLGASDLKAGAKVTRFMSVLREGRYKEFRSLLRSDPEAARLKGVGGTTPLMYAALYGDADTVRAVLAAGADPNVKNDSGVTALMLAVEDAAKTRLLLQAKADPNARSQSGRTSLIMAASSYGSGPVVKLLLDGGADPNLLGALETSAMAEAGAAGDETTFRMLLEHGADIKKTGFLALALTMRTPCKFCVDTLLSVSTPGIITQAAFRSTPPGSDGSDIKILLDHGANVNTINSRGRSLLMVTASSDALPVHTAKALLDAGANVNAPGPQGWTALDFAQQRGKTAMVDLLIASGAKASLMPAENSSEFSPAPSLREAIARSLPALQHADVAFLSKAGCISCHHNSLTAMAVVAARDIGIPVDNGIEASQLKVITKVIDAWRDRVLQGVPLPGDVDTIGYALLGLAAENYSPDASTDALARYLKTHQTSTGTWQLYEYRPPLESSQIELAAAAVRGMQIYAPKAQRAEYERTIRLAAKWMAQAQPQTNEDRVFKLLGLHWAGAGKDVDAKLARELLAEQRPDGGWAQIPSLSSDAYATGQALTALHETGALPVSDARYMRGVEFLQNTQLADGTWHVKTRAMPVQTYFETGYPHGIDQFISAAATNWAVLALAPAARNAGGSPSLTSARSRLQ